jgi:deoxyribonuclease V
VLEAFAQVETVPNLLMVDGQGLAHPRGFGIAGHLGVLLDLPSIRGAKSRLYGRYEAAGLAEGAVTDMPLTDSHGQVIGSVMRTNPRTNPLFISPGHKVSVLSATQIVADCLRGYRLPEPTRQAHNLITAYKKIGARDPIIVSPVSVQETLSL